LRDKSIFTNHDFNNKIILFRKKKFMDLSEEEVDANLTSYLQKPVQKKKRTFDEVHEETEINEEDEEGAQPCSKKTKDDIYNLWTHSWHEEGEKLLPLVQKLSAMTESEAKAYLACLKAVSSRSAHKHLTDRLLMYMSNFSCHPNDVITPIHMQEDEYLKTGASMLVSDFLGYLGRIGFVALLFAYAGTSRYFHRQEAHRKRTKLSIAGEAGPTTEALQVDGVRPGGDGENHSHGEAIN
jgi:hypothetical protein